MQLDKVKINPYDIGFLRGYGVFDVMCTQNKKPFLLNEHWERFQNSAKELNLKIPVTKNKYEKIIEKILNLNNYSKSNIRTVLTGGASSNGFNQNLRRETFLIIIEKFHSLPKKLYADGAAVMTLEYKRQFPLAKITNYVAAIKNQQLKAKNKALEIIYLENGKALEASTSNFFIVKNNKLITAKDGILFGTTRNLTVKLAKQNNLEVEERNINEKELIDASEIFLTATNKDIVPVIKVDDKKIGNGKAGKITKLLMQAFENFTKNY